MILGKPWTWATLRNSKISISKPKLASINNNTYKEAKSIKLKFQTRVIFKKHVSILQSNYSLLINKQKEEEVRTTQSKLCLKYRFIVVCKNLFQLFPNIRKKLIRLN